MFCVRVIGISVRHRALHTTTTVYASAVATEAKSNPWFDKILIANRGEIACRVIKTARRMGIKTVAVFSEADRFARHVHMADEAVCVGPAPSAESYLRVDNIIDAIKQTGAQAVHPGYGFLSENSAFATKIEEMGIAFIGPGHFAINAMGDKIESKKLARSAKVNTIPGVLAEIADDETVLKISNDIGYPVMIKASAGGGGKGMRIAWNDKQAIEGFRLSKQEAKASFGDDRIFIEKFIDNPRHIEIQLIGDSHGNVLYLPERECSIQRRNQKVIEEAPSPFIDPETRKAMGEQAVALAKAVKYKSAGTCEFLVDSQRNFYFLEMNTRLQVEHPITEYITGLDLVEQMIRVAAGEKLSFTQDDVQLKGWAFESRVYAEDPFRNYLPSIGKLDRYREPKGEHVRVDTGVVQGSDISIYYDPMISKLVTYGENRDEALNGMIRALDEYVIRGVTHNIPLLRDVLDAKRFREGKLTTKYLNEEYPDGYKGHILNEDEQRQVAAISAIARRIFSDRDETAPGKLSRYQRPAQEELVIGLGDEKMTVELEDVDMGSGLYEAKVNGKTLSVFCAWNVDDPIIEAHLIDSPESEGVEVVAQIVRKYHDGIRIQIYGSQFDVKVQTPREADLSQHMPVKEPIDTTRFLVCPMPGSIVSIAVKPGDKVVLGQEILIVEAMKMQNILSANGDAVVKEVKCKVGESVASEDILIEFEPLS